MVRTGSCGLWVATAQACTGRASASTAAHAGPATAIGSLGDQETDDPCPACPPVPADQDDNSAANEIALGVDTHSDRHVAAVLTTLGTRLSSKSFAEVVLHELDALVVG
jgi:hypothetical protein